MKKAPCAYSRKVPCCSVTFCPLVPAWATTIHKFQGFEAGKETWDTVQNLIIDPGCIMAENRSPGILYVAVSRGKTMGSMSATNKHPTDSAIYFEGSNMSENRVRWCSTTYNKKTDDRDKKEGVIKRDKWVHFLLKRADKTRQETYTDERLKEIEKNTLARAIKCPYSSSEELESDIIKMLRRPNDSWRRRRSKYTIQRSFFN